eukprot:126840_1
MANKKFSTTRIDYSIYDVVNQTPVQNGCVPPIDLEKLKMLMSNVPDFPFESNHDHQPFDPKHLAIKSRVSYQKCMHNKAPNPTCHGFIDLITRIILKMKTQNVPNLNDAEFRFLILCKHCIVTLVSSSVFMDRWNKCLTQFQVTSKSPSKVSENENIITLSLCVLSSLFICPRIAKQMFLKYWKNLFDIFRNLLRLLDQIGSQIFSAYTDRTRSLKVINGDPTLTRHFHHLRSICNSLSSHVHRVDLYFTSKHWKYFVKHELFELLCRATFHEYSAMKFQNQDGVRIDFTGKTIENCFYTELFFTAFGCNTKYSKIFNNAHVKAMTSFLTHPRKNHPHFVPRHSILWKMIDPHNPRLLQYRSYKVLQEYWRTYKASKECHSPKCNKIEFYQKGICFKKCEDCRIVFYCSKRCQKYDWSRGDHRLYCKLLQHI